MTEGIHFALFAISATGPRTQTTVGEQQCLAKWAKGALRIAEIGVYHAVNSRNLLNAADPTSQIWLVDPYTTGKLGICFAHLIARSVLKLFPAERLHWMKMTGAEAGRILNEQCGVTFDFVFIDGDHSYQGVAADWEAFTPLIRRGGIMALHDSIPSEGNPIFNAGSVRFFEEKIRRDPRFEFIDSQDSLAVIKRR